MKDVRRIGTLLRILTVGAAIVLTFMMARAMHALFFLLKGESVF